MAIRMLVLSLTGACNLACSYCYASEQNPQVMTFDTARKAIALAALGGRFDLQFSGGEPLLAFSLLKQIAEYVKAEKIPARMAIQTNGTLITTEVAEFFKRAKIGIGVSLDGRPPIHDRQRYFAGGIGSANKVVAGIQRLADSGIEIGLTCVVTAENVNDLVGIVEMAYFLGNVRRLGFDLLRSQGRGVAVVPAPAQAVEQNLISVFRRHEELAGLTGRKLLISQVEQAVCLTGRSRDGFSHCHAMNGEGVHVSAEGNIYGCSSFVGDDRFLLGDVDSGIDGKRQYELAAFMQAGLTECQACQDFSACGGACYARQSGRRAMPSDSPECALKRAAIREVALSRVNKGEC